jgi:hypothetical protein
MFHRAASILVVLCLAPALGGCFLIKNPDKANIALRKQSQEQQARIAELERQTAGDAAMIRSLQERTGTLPTLPHERLQRLFTTHDVTLGRLTGGADLDPAKPGHEGLKIYATPVDQTGDQLKAAGAFTVEAFDHARGEGMKIGTWTFDVAASRAAWSSVLNRYNYVLTCPWQTPPQGADLHVVITFVDELTQGRFKKTADVKVDVPPPSSSSSQPATSPAPAPAAGG